MWGRFTEVHWTIQCAMYETMELLLIEFLWGPREQQGCLCFTAFKQKICFMNAAYLAAVWCATSVAPFSAAFISKSRQICINIWFWQIVKTRVVNCDGNFVHNLATMCIYGRYIKLEKKGKRGSGGYGHKLLHLPREAQTYVFLPGMRKDFSEPANQGPNSSETAGQCQ